MSKMDACINGVCSKLRSILEEAVKKNVGDGILFSGGLDTSVLAVIASKLTSLKAFTVAFQDAPAPDVKYATLMAGNLGLKHFVHYFDEEELCEAIRVVVKTMRSFDPMEIRNSVAIYIGLKAAKEREVNTVITGDGCDELFAGYSFLFDLEGERLDTELQKLWEGMTFSSIPLGKAVGVEVKVPFLDPRFKAFSVKLDSRYKVRWDKGRKWGKWIIRKVFEDVLPKEVAWRVKMPIEHGSGTTVLSRLFNKIITNQQFEEKRISFLERDKVKIRDKEQLFYYEVYRSTIGVPHPTDLEGKRCPQCNSNMAERSSYCKTCGAYPV